MTDFVISEEQLREMVFSKYRKVRDNIWSDVRSRPLSDELESAYKNGFNDGQAEGLSDESKAHKDFAKNYFATLLDCDCQVCIDAREAHDTAIRKAERERVCNKIMKTLDNDPFYGGSRWKYQEVCISVRGEP